MRLIYLNVVIVIGKAFENMIENLDMGLQKMIDAGLKFKCHLFVKEVFLRGHVITKDEIRFKEDKGSSSMAQTRKGA